MSASQALARLVRADHVLLGEVHDNPAHHRERADLLAALAARRPTVVMEQLPTSGDAALAVPPGPDLAAWLAGAGFDLRAWAWPLHRPVVEAALRAGLPLRGGNLDRDVVRQVARQGAQAAPAELRASMDVPLPDSAITALDEALVAGHCGQLPPAAVPRMRDAQIARDLAMADALLRAADASANPTVLIAGNGHVRRDHGVPLWLDRLRPGARVVSVGFLEAEPNGALPPAAALAVYDMVWVTPRVPRADPCAGFSMPPATRAASPPLPPPGR